MVNFFRVHHARSRMTRACSRSAEMKKKYTNEADFRLAMREWRKSHDFPAGSIHDVVDHIDHIVKVAGVDHVGLGSDFDGITKCPRQLEDVSFYPYLTQELLNRGYSDEQVLKILGGNLLRVLRAAETVARGVRDGVS